MRLWSRVNFLITEVTGWIFRPGIAGELLGAHPSIATANIPIGARPAAALERTGFGLQTRHQWIGSIRPDL